MRKSHVWILLAAVFATVGLLAGAGAANMMAAQPTKIAIVDVIKVRNGLNEAKVISAEIEAKLQKYEQEHKGRLEEIESLREDLSILTPDSEAFDEKQRQLLAKTVEAKTWQEVAKVEITHEHTIQLESLFRQIVQASTDIATLHGYDMVLSQEREINFRNAKPKEIDALISLRKILWSRDEMDVTEQVIQKMNNDFANAM